MKKVWINICMFLVSMSQIHAIFRMNGYRYDPYTDFGKISGDIVIVPNIDSKDVTIIDVHYNYAHNPEDKSLIVIGVFYDTPEERSRAVIYKYDFAGVLQKTVYPTDTTNVNIFIESTARVLWEDDYFYIPMYTLHPASGNIALQKYSYNLELDEDFAVNGTWLFGGPDHDYYRAGCIVHNDDRKCEGGIIVNTDHNIARYHILNFVSPGVYAPFEGIVETDLTENIVGMIMMHFDDHLYAVITNRSGQGRSVELVHDVDNNTYTIVEIDVPNKDEYPFHALYPWDENRFLVASNNKLLIWRVNEDGTLSKSVDEGVFDIALVPGALNAQTFNFYSMTPTVNQLILSGSYKKNDDQRYPLVVAFNVEDLINIHRDVTFFEKGYWTSSKSDLHPGLATPFPLTITKHLPFSFILGVSDQLVHIYPGFFDKDTTLSGRVRDRSNRGDYIPFAA